MQKIVQTAIGRLIKEFIDKPFNFLYESDLQARLYGLIYESLSSTENELTIPVSDIWKAVIGKEIKTALLKTEYPSRKRFDIAIIDPNPEKIVQRSPGDNSESFWAQHVKIGIELKYYKLDEQLTGREGYINGRGGLLEDKHKLESYANKNYKSGGFCGIGILFVQHYNDEDFKKEVSAAVPDIQLISLRNIEIKSEGIQCFVVIKDHQKNKATLFQVV